MFVLSMVLIMFVVIGIGCHRAEPKDGEELVIQSNYERIDVVRARVLDTGKSMPGWGFVIVTNPKDNDDYYFKRKVMILSIGITPSNRVVEDCDIKCGDEIFFILISATGDDPVAISQDMLKGTISGYYMAVEYKGVLDNNRRLINPPKK
ncbi:MAG: hypothetical protein V1686_02675 [Patescibacteria group bacterium]